MNNEVKTGLFVGLNDIAFVYPLAVIATRRETGLSLQECLKRGRFYNGISQASILIPYSISIEYINNHVLKEQGLMSSSLTSVIVALGLQPIEKLMTTLQLVEKKRDANPLVDIYKYAKNNNLRHLYKGFTPLYMRETVYIMAITYFNPILVKNNNTLPLLKYSSAFLLCFLAGLITAPIQTMNALMKSEMHKNDSIVEIYNKQNLTIKRLYYGSVIRSVRCGCAGILWTVGRELFSNDADDNIAT